MASEESPHQRDFQPPLKGTKQVVNPDNSRDQEQDFGKGHGVRSVYTRDRPSGLPRAVTLMHPSTMRTTRVLLATMALMATPLAQAPNDPFPTPIPAVEGVIKVDFVEFATIPDSEGQP